jgi:hypothetical protein
MKFAINLNIGYDDKTIEEVLTTKMAVFRVVAPCSLVEVY